MDEQTVQLIAAAIIAITEMYAIRGSSYPAFAYFWDFIATICGCIANVLARISIRARLCYFEAIEP